MEPANLDASQIATEIRVTPYASSAPREIKAFRPAHGSLDRRYGMGRTGTEARLSPAFPKGFVARTRACP
jgi:hypothetical protein